MSDSTDDSARPAKRARLDDNAQPSFSAATSTITASQAATTASTVAIDTDLEREVRAGITEYVCPDNLGFTGVLKQRYTDFLVNEIALDGQVLHLRSTQPPKKKEGKQVNGSRSIVEGSKRIDTKEEKLVVKEENGEANMPDVSSGGDTTIETPVKTEDTPAQDQLVIKEEGDAQPEVKTEEVKLEPEIELTEDDRVTLDDIFGEETTNQIVKLASQVRRREQRKAKDFKAVIAPPITDKEKRTQAHKSLRRIFPSLLESSMEADQSIRIKATPPAERKGKNKGKGGGRDRGDNGGSRSKGPQMWEELGGEYLHFNLYKENKDTMEIVGFLGSKLGGGAKAFGFAGTKDRRACTVQRVCVKRQTAERMFSFNKILYNAAIGDWEYQPNGLTLGNLMGNEFTITLRDCHFQGEEGMDYAQRYQLANQVVGKSIEDFSQKGFINYYGLQRFGSFAASTDSIGRKMLQDDLKGAVDDILAYSDVALAAAQGTLPEDSDVLVSHDDRNRAKALHLWHTEGKASQALDSLPRKFTAERNMIQHLGSRNSRNGQYDRKSDWQGALMTIPRTLRLMYVHAYQSLVWNAVAGKRWTTHGDKVVEGDLVLVHEHRDKEANKETIKQEDTDDSGEVVINPTGTENANAGAEAFERARPLTKEEAESGQYSVWDIVLPQPGFDVEYPKNDIGDFYKDFMGSDKGGGLDPHNMRRGWREVSLSGGYRKFLARPLKPVEFEVYKYWKEDEQFVETDLQRLRKESGEASQTDRTANGAVKKDVEIEDGEEMEEVKEEDKLAVVIKLQLASSQYATMALRELMKAGGVKAYKPEFMGGR
ncbi:pseudouridine synthase [Paraphoma chrysanthemicola]|uniref:Pseudouridine synthase n=1 Tax=Paraphoma chrysanthemicola TaxID=798071 RepID=A0A8K0VWN9_9PLEO|nr:pseudouridine synthase [Paraphoma chrysanthemicola]